MLDLNDRRYTYVYVSDYDTADAYISRGRKKTTRPLYHKNLAISLRDNGKSIGIHFRNWGPDFIRYVPGDKAVISLPATHNYVSTREIIKVYSNLIDLYQRNNKVYIRQSIDTVSPSRQVRCPRCKGRKVLWYQCNGLKSKRGNTSRYIGIEMQAFNGQKIWIYECNCLNSNPNLDPNNHRGFVNCSFCNGNGYREFGNKYQPFQWDGSPIGIDLKTGLIIPSTIKKPGINEALQQKGGAYVN